MEIIKYGIAVITGFIIAIIALKNQAFINVMKKVNWSGLAFWGSIILGAIIPIVINHVYVKKQETIKLKSKLVQDKIDVLREYKEFDVFMRLTVYLDKEISDLNFDYEPTIEDASAPTLRGLHILQSHETYNDWKLKNMVYMEKLKGLGNYYISSYTDYLLNYILNVDILVNSVPDTGMWEVSIAVKNDFMDISKELNIIIDKYLNNTLYKLKNESYKKEDSMNQNKINKKLNETNLIKYRSQLSDLKVR